MPVHSITHIKLFFEGGTFYGGQGLAPLEGAYFRPLMTTTFSLVYSVFGAHPFYYHFLQLLLYIGSAVLLFLFFRYSFSLPLSLGLSLIFLVHPMNSQTVYAIPSMQDALYFFFGILALNLLIRYTSIKGLLAVTGCLFIALFAKETAVLFILLAGLYLFWWDRKRFVPYLASWIIPALFYIPLRIHAVGFLNNPEGGPIDNLSLPHRIYTAPSIVEFYITHIIWPWKMATGYYWTYTTISVSHVILPFLFDLLVLGAFVFMAYLLSKRASKAMLYTYLYFMVWCLIGFVLLVQIEPLDLTASDIWLYFPFAGLLGMIGVVCSVYRISRLKHVEWLYILPIVIICAFGIRSFYRGLDYHNPYKLSMIDVRNSTDDYRADKIIAGDLINQGNYIQAGPYEARAIRVFPQYGDFINMADILLNDGDYAEAEVMYKDSVPFAGPDSLHQSYEGMGALTLFTGSDQSDRQILITALQKYPNDSLLWTYLAVLDDKNGDNADAQIAIRQAAKYGQVPPSLYNGITNNQHMTVTIAGRVIYLP